MDKRFQMLNSGNNQYQENSNYDPESIEVTLCIEEAEPEFPLQTLPFGKPDVTYGVPEPTSAVPASDAYVTNFFQE